MLLHAKSRTNDIETITDVNGYFRHFGLRQDPFSSEGKENCFYLLPDWEQHVDLILHYLRHENVLLTLTGSKGVGKTTLINSFLLEAIHGFSPTETAAQSKLCAGEMLVQLGDTTRTCQVIADNAFDPEQILEVITSAFDLPTELLVGPLEEQTDLLLENIQHSKQRCVLLIDQAHELPDATLALLLHLIDQQSDIQHQFHVVLIGESTLKKRFVKLTKSKDQLNIIHTIELSPLNLAQTEYYLKHRLSAAGLQDEIPFSTSSIQKIYKHSGGVPKTINQLARQLLIENLKKNNFSSLAAIFKPYKKTMVGGIFLLTSFAVILFYLSQDTKTPNSFGHDTTQSPPVVIEHESVQPITLPSPLPPQPAIAEKMEAVSPTNSTPNPNSTTPVASPEATPIALSATPPAQTINNTAQIIPQATIQPNPETLTPEPTSLSKQETLIPESTDQNASQSLVVKSSTLIEPDSVPATDIPTQTPFLLPKDKLKNKSTAHKITESSPPMLKSKSADQDIVAKTKARKDSAQKMEKLHSEKRFTHMNPHHFTLKLTEVPGKTALLKVLSKNKSEKNLMYFQTEDKHYIIVYGEYADSATARHAAELLPKSLTSFEATPYRVGALQKMADE